MVGPGFLRWRGALLSQYNYHSTRDTPLRHWRKHSKNMNKHMNKETFNKSLSKETLERKIKEELAAHDMWQPVKAGDPYRPDIFNYRDTQEEALAAPLKEVYIITYHTGTRMKTSTHPNVARAMEVAEGHEKQGHPFRVGRYTLTQSTYPTTAGDGYRFLKEEETIAVGDEYWDLGSYRWETCDCTWTTSPREVARDLRTPYRRWVGVKGDLVDKNYRPLGPGETLRAGDGYFNSRGEWCNTCLGTTISDSIHSACQYYRPL
jgi:hypothetical protein